MYFRCCSVTEPCPTLSDPMDCSIPGSPVLHYLPEYAWYLKLAPWRKSYDKPRQRIKKQRHHFADKVLSSQSYDFSTSYVRMWKLEHKEGWALKNWHFWTMVLEKTRESPLDSKEIQPVHPKGNQFWIFIGRTDAEAEAPIRWPPDTKSWLIEKTLMLGRIEGRRRRGWQRMR